jgi:general stress protein 26
MTEHSDDVAKLVELTKDIRIAMLTTVEENGSFTARPMAQQQVEPDGSLWFFAERDAHVVTHIGINPHVGVALSSGDSWVSINGTAALVDDVQKKRELWNPVVEAWLPQGAEDPAVVLIRVESESAEYWDTPGGRVASVFSFVKAKVTGEPYQGTESAKLDL